MTIPVQPTFTASIANGVTTVFPYGFKIAAEEDLAVTIDGVIQTSGYTVSGVGNPAGGNVTFSVAPANLKKVVRYLAPVMKRDTDYQQFGDWLADVVNLDFDRIWLALQTLKQNDIRSLKLPIDTTTDQALTQDAAARANKTIKFDASGNLTISNYDPDDVQTAAAISAAAALASQNASEISESNALADAVAAFNSADTASSMATIATNKANEAAASAALALGYEGAASGYALAASGSASSASNSASLASGYADTASSAATSASGSAVSSAASATSASGSAVSASSSATAASGSAVSAASSATAASGFAAAAAASAGSITPVETQIHAAASKTTPVGADEIGIVDTENGNILKKLTLTNLFTWLRAGFDSVYMELVAPGTSGNVLTSNGSSWVSSAPSAGAATHLIANSSDLTLAAFASSYTAVGSTFSATIPANGILSIIGFAGAFLNDATAGGHYVGWGIRIGSTNYWFGASKNAGGAITPGFLQNLGGVANDTNSMYGPLAGQYQASTVMGEAVIDVTALSVPTGAQTVQLIAGYAGFPATIKGTTQQTRVLLRIEG